MKKQSVRPGYHPLRLLLGLLVLLLPGCASPAVSVSQKDFPPIEIQGPIRKPTTEEAAEKADEGVYLVVNGGWDYSVNRPNEDLTYLLTEDDSAVIYELFYDHEQEVLNSPLESIALLTFQIGDDRLSSSLSCLDSFAGRVGGQLILVELNVSEQEAVYRIISSYVTDLQNLG